MTAYAGGVATIISATRRATRYHLARVQKKIATTSWHACYSRRAAHEPVQCRLLIWLTRCGDAAAISIQAACARISGNLGV